MELSWLTLIVNATLVVVGIGLTLILLRLGARHEYYYGVSHIQAPMRRWILIILLVLLAMSFMAGAYNLIVPWVFGV